MALLLAKRPGGAQTAPAAWPRHQWEVSTQLAAYPRIALAGTTAGQGRAGYVRPWPVLLTVRYYTRPRASVEAGLLLRLAPDQTTTATSSTGTYRIRTHATTWALPLLSRVQLAPQQGQRWQIDGELGVMPLATKYSEETSFTPIGSGRADAVGNSSQSYSDLPVVMGLGGGYRLTQRLALVADARLTWSFLITIVGQALTHRSDFVAPVTPALSAGVSYQFKPMR